MPHQPLAHQHTRRQRVGRRLRRPHAAFVAVVAIVMLGASVLGACTSPDAPPKPEEIAAKLATGLAGGDLTGVTFDGSTTEAASTAVKDVVGKLTGIPRTVTVAGVTPKADDPTKATATLSWHWDVAPTDDDWRYTTEAKLSLGADKTWHVQWSPTLIEPKLTASERFAVDRVQAKRGEIRGAGGVVLAGLRDVYNVGIDKARIAPEQAAASATALATLMGIDPVAYAKSVTAGGAKQFVVAITLRASDPRIAGKTAAVQAIPGGVAVAGELTLAVSPTFARAVLGTVGPATAEIVAASGGRVSATDIVGLSGLQQRYNTYLSGTPGLKIRAVGTDSAGGATSRSLFSQEPIAGPALITTLDLEAQQAAEAALASAPVPTSLVAIRPSTGEVVAAATSPTAQGSLAMTGRAAPGSTFKLISSLALLRAGLTPESPLPCTPTVTVDGRLFKNYDAYPDSGLGQISLRTALANSCNTAFISQHGVVSQDALADAAAALGFGVDFQMGVSSFLGSIPRTATATEHGASFIGQAKVEASALSMAIVVASIVKGATVVPRMVEIPAQATASGAAPAPETSGDGSTAPAAGIAPSRAPSAAPSASPSATSSATPLPTTPPPPAKPLTADEAAALRSMMASVVTDGSGKVLAGLGVTGAKTGTAQYGSADPPLTHTWMVASRGDLAVAVYVETGQSGTVTTAPYVKAFLQGWAG